MRMLYQVVGWYLWMINLIAFALMGVDKAKARRDCWRIRERTLFVAPLLGGSLGGVLGMQVFRHKTRHWQFRYGLPLLLVVQLGLAAWIISYWL